MKISTGNPYPLGATPSKKGINFSIFTESEEEVFLCLFSEDIPSLEISIPYRTGKLRHLYLHEPDERYSSYAFRIKYNEKGDPKYYQDPLSKFLTSSHEWNHGDSYNPFGILSTQEIFDWEDDKPPDLPSSELIIYEMHVRGFTQHSSSKVEKKGGFLGIIEKIPYLLDLGINAVELLPIFEFNEKEYKLLHSSSDKDLFQYWGYSTVNYFSPMQRYASSNETGAAAQEFKTLVKELHKNGIEVILDVVYNHTAEGNKDGPEYSFKGLANNVYYMMQGPKEYANYTGCGNTFNCNHPIVRTFILDSLRYWVAEMHVDGFRFDLASVFYRGQKGEVLANPPLLDVISEDPLLSHVKLIAEPWDAGGLYQVGAFYPESKRWSEWNGKYRDSVRKFIKGEKGLKGEFATRLCGSQDLYDQRRSPSSSINFITAHDGFCLNDLVSYNEKHNQDNGEENRDGDSNNNSWNCGAEGETNDEKIHKLRQKQMRNFQLALMVSHGIPMVLMGDEYGHTKKGNNNTWCQDNELNWFLWDQLEEKAAFHRFFKGLIHFRRHEPLLKRKQFLKNEDIEWHGVKPFYPNWDKDDRFLAFTLIDERTGEDLYIAFNANSIDFDVTFPKAHEKKSWHWIANTAADSPNDFFEVDKAPKVGTKHFKMVGYSALLLKAF